MDDWINCNSDVDSGLEKYCCEKAHAVGAAAAKLGLSIIANLAVQYLQDSLEDPRIHESPTSICHYYDLATMFVYHGQSMMRIMQDTPLLLRWQLKLQTASSMVTDLRRK
ncbi:hypothetical protein V1506DRAFT_522845 [Lipomyces tetrasporus]